MPYPYVTSPDHSFIKFLRAKGFTSGRPLGRPIWHVVHDMEAPETFTRAEQTAEYFYDGAGGRSVSSTYCHDADSTVQSVLLRDSAWTVGNTEGNALGINHEYAGYARQNQGDWLDDFGRRMFAVSRRVIVPDCAEFGIPFRWLSDTEVRAKRPGFTSHVQLGRVFGGSDHTDPGPGFPYVEYMKIMIGVDSMAGFMFRVNDEPNTPLWISDGIRRRLVRGTPTGATSIGGTLERAGFVDLGTLNSGADSAEAYATKVGGPVDPGEFEFDGELPPASSTPGDCVTADDVRTIVREELDATRFAKA